MKKVTSKKRSVNGKRVRSLKKLAKIPEPRQPKKLKHKLTVVLLYGLLMYVFQMAARREANAELSKPMFFSTLQQLFPELETLPPADTLNRVLARLEVEQLEAAHIALVQQLIHNKKFQRSLIEKRYPIAIELMGRKSWSAPARGGAR